MTHDLTVSQQRDQEMALESNRAKRQDDIERHLATHPQPTMIDVIRELSRDESVKPEKLRELYELQLLAEAREAERQFNIDFAAAMSEMPTIGKDKVKGMGNDKAGIPYASYEKIDAIVRRIEFKYGFCRTFSTERTDKAGSLMTVTLLHKGGHSIKSTRYLPPDQGPGRSGDATAQGSSDSYNKRYLTIGIWNLVTIGADDDGKKSEAITEAQSANMNSLISETGMNSAARDLFFLIAGVKSVEEVPQYRYKDLMIALQQKRAAKK